MDVSDIHLSHYPGLCTPSLGAPSDACRPAADACRRLPAAADACRCLPTPSASFFFGVGCEALGSGPSRAVARAACGDAALRDPRSACVKSSESERGVHGGAGRWWRRGVVEARLRGMKRRAAAPPPR
eukprot:355609-Chlamydomonas_euryale.AAC.2